MRPWLGIFAAAGVQHGPTTDGNLIPWEVAKMLWNHVVDRYFQTRGVCPQYERDTRHRALALDLFAGRLLEIGEVTPELVNAFLAEMQKEGRHYERTVKGYRDAILAVWRFAWEQRWTDVRPERVRTIKVRRKMPNAWTIDEIRTLAAAAEKLPGKVHGIPVARSLWFATYVHLLWCTGLQVGDLLALTWAAVQRQQRQSIIMLSQSKTNQPLLCALSPQAVSMATDIRNRTDSPLVLPWPGARCILDRWFRRLVKRSGIRPGATREIRRAAASYVERDNPGLAGRFLGHLTPGLAARHYIDPTITQQSAIRPPEL